MTDKRDTPQALCPSCHSQIQGACLDHWRVRRIYDTPPAETGREVFDWCPDCRTVHDIEEDCPATEPCNHAETIAAGGGFCPYGTLVKSVQGPAETKAGPLCAAILADGTKCERLLENHINPKQFVSPEPAAPVPPPKPYPHWPAVCTCPLCCPSKWEVNAAMREVVPVSPEPPRQGKMAISEVVIKPLECFLRLAQLAAKETLSEDDHFDYVSMLTFAHSMAEQYLDQETCKLTGEAGTVGAKPEPYDTSNLNDWGNSTGTPEERSQFWRKAWQSKCNEVVALRASLPSPAPRPYFEQWWEDSHWAKARMRAAYKDVARDVWRELSVPPPEDSVCPTCGADIRCIHGLLFSERCEPCEAPDPELASSPAQPVGTQLGPTIGQISQSGQNLGINPYQPENVPRQPVGSADKEQL